MLNKFINTVTGPIEVNDLGKTLMHEHFVFGYPGFEGDKTCSSFNRKTAIDICINAVENVKKYNVQTIIDATPNECGRDVELLQKIAEATGVNIICSTGFYFEGEGASAYFKFRNKIGNAEQEIYEMMLQEVTGGIEGTKIRAGVIKIASSENIITEYEKMFFRAAAKVQKETGVNIITHTQAGTMGPEQARLLISEGADPRKIMIGHMCGNINTEYTKKVLAQGVYIGLDRFGLEGFIGCPTDEEREQLVIDLLKMGYEDKIMFSHDTVNVMRGRPVIFPAATAKVIEKANITRIFDVIIPKLKKSGVSDTQIKKIITENPRQFFA